MNKLYGWNYHTNLGWNFSHLPSKPLSTPYTSMDCVDQ